MGLVQTLVIGAARDLVKFCFTLVECRVFEFVQTLRFDGEGPDGGRAQENSNTRI